TIDGRQWDTLLPGGTTMDAVHRSVLLRFPGAADQIADLLRAGRVLLKAELALRFAGTEIVPRDYLCRDALGRKVWTENPPSWHVQAWAGFRSTPCGPAHRGRDSPWARSRCRRSAAPARPSAARGRRAAGRRSGRPRPGSAAAPSGAPRPSSCRPAAAYPIAGHRW